MSASETKMDSPLKEQSAELGARETKPPVALALAEELIARLKSQEMEEELAEKIERAVLSGAQAATSIMVGSTLTGAMSQSVAWSLAVKNPAFDEVLKGLMERSGAAAATRLGKQAIPALRASAIFSAMARGEAPKERLGEEEFGLALNHWRAEEGLRFLIGQPDFTILITVLTAHCLPEERPGSIKASPKPSQETLAPNEEPILAPWEVELAK